LEYGDECCSKRIKITSRKLLIKVELISKHRNTEQRENIDEQEHEQSNINE
jgi:hypothetical protein